MPRRRAGKLNAAAENTSASNLRPSGNCSPVPAPAQTAREPIPASSHAKHPMPFRVTKQEQKILLVLAALLVLGTLGLWLI